MGEPNLDNRSWSGLLDQSGAQWSPGPKVAPPAQASTSVQPTTQPSSSRQTAASGSATPRSANPSPLLSSRVLAPGPLLGSSPSRQPTPHASPTLVYRHITVPAAGSGDPTSGASVTPLFSTRAGSPPRSTASFVPMPPAAGHTTSTVATVSSHARRPFAGAGPNVMSHYALGTAVPPGA